MIMYGRFYLTIERIEHTDPSRQTWSSPIPAHVKMIIEDQTVLIELERIELLLKRFPIIILWVIESSTLAQLDTDVNRIS